MIFDLIYASLTAYIVTVVVTKGSIFQSFRIWFKEKTPKLAITGHPHYIECRLCFGSLASLLSAFIFNVPALWFAIWGLSYFMATQER